jgi:FAD binding domain
LDLITRTDSSYDDARAVFNAMIDRYPAVIARCATPGDVASALELARRERLPVAVRAGGHSVAGMSVNDGGIVIDVRPMRQIDIDPRARTATAGAGVSWGEFDAATQLHGLATTGGRVSTTGIAGFTLGGGSGWAERRFGLACDNLISVDLVTADGELITASATSHPDLFWALHGGGGNFGVATALQYQLHPLGPTALAGLLLWPADAGREVARAYRDLAADAASELGSGLVFLTAPPEEFVPDYLQGETVVGMALLWAGDPGEGQDAVRPFLDLEPAVNLVAPMPYCKFQQLIDDPPGKRNYWSADSTTSSTTMRWTCSCGTAVSASRRIRSRFCFPGAARSPTGASPTRPWPTARCDGSPTRSRSGRTPPLTMPTSPGLARTGVTSPGTPPAGST